jgi:hypothetical protein
MEKDSFSMTNFKGVVEWMDVKLDVPQLIYLGIHLVNHGRWPSAAIDIGHEVHSIRASLITNHDRREVHDFIE